MTCERRTRKTANVSTTFKFVSKLAYQKLLLGKMDTRHMYKRSISPYSVQMQESADQNNSETDTFDALKRFDGIVHPSSTLKPTSGTSETARTSNIHKLIRSWLCLVDCIFSNLQHVKKGIFSLLLYMG